MIQLMYDQFKNKSKEPRPKKKENGGVAVMTT